MTNLGTHVVGGSASTLERVGERAGTAPRRPAPGRAVFVRDVLLLLEKRRWPGAPRWLGINERGRQAVTYISGHVALSGRDRAPDVWTDRCLQQLGRLVREFHDLTAQTPLAGTAETVCHNDLAPRNTVTWRRAPGVYEPAAFIGWDKAAPGARIEDLAHLGWQFLFGRPERRDPNVVARCLRILCDGYGPVDRSELVPAMLDRQDRYWRAVEAAARAGDPASQQQVEWGYTAAARTDFAWTQQHRALLTHAIG